MAAGNLIVVRSEDASHGGDDAESGEVATGNKLKGDALGLLAEGKAGRSGKAAKHVREDFVVLAKVAEHGVGDGVATPIAAIVAAFHGEKNELLGVLDGKEAQQNLVEESENGGVCADAEGES